MIKYAEIYKLKIENEIRYVAKNVCRQGRNRRRKF